MRRGQARKTSLRADDHGLLADASAHIIETFIRRTSSFCMACAAILLSLSLSGVREPCSLKETLLRRLEALRDNNNAGG